MDLGSSPSAPPAFDATRGYIPLRSGQLVAIDLANGAQAWTRAGVTAVGPAVDSGRLFLVGNGELEAIDTRDGHPLWKVPLAGPVSRRVAARGGWVVVAPDSGDVLALRAEDGKTVWTATIGGALQVDPLIEADRLYVASPTRGIVALDILSGKVLWERTLEGAPSSLAVVPGAIYTGTQGRWFYALDEKSGRPRWHWRIGGEAVGIDADDRVVVTLLLDHSIRAFRVGNGAQEWREALQYRPFAGPVKVPAQWLVAGHGAVIRAYNRTDGHRAGSYTLPPINPLETEQLDGLMAPPHFSPGPTIFDDLLVLVSQRGLLHGTRRQLLPAPTPLTTLPGVPLPAPAAPPAAPATTPP